MGAHFTTRDDPTETVFNKTRSALTRSAGHYKIASIARNKRSSRYPSIIRSRREHRGAEGKSKKTRSNCLIGIDSRSPSTERKGIMSAGCPRGNNRANHRVKTHRTSRRVNAPLLREDGARRLTGGLSLRSHCPHHIRLALHPVNCVARTLSTRIKVNDKYATASCSFRLSFKLPPACAHATRSVRA